MCDFFADLIIICNFAKEKEVNDMERELNYSDITYGLIGIKKSDNIFPKGERIVIMCDRREYNASIPKAGNYISGLGECHRLHKAIIGTKISIVKGLNNTYILEYKTEIENDNPVQQAVFLLENYPWMFCKNETTVRCEVIDPILKYTGWEFPNLRREVYMGKGKGQADYILYYEDSPKIIIEAKSHDNELNPKDIKAQLLKYWINSYRISSPKDILAIATNGQEWQLWQYDSDAVMCTNADIIQSPDVFKLFVELLSAIHNNDTSVDRIVTDIKKHKSERYSSKRHSAFEITKIQGTTVTERFQKFIKQHSSKIRRNGQN